MTTPAMRVLEAYAEATQARRTAREVAAAIDMDHDDVNRYTYLLCKRGDITGVGEKRKRRYRVTLAGLSRLSGRSPDSVSLAGLDVVACAVRLRPVLQTIWHQPREAQQWQTT